MKLKLEKPFIRDDWESLDIPDDTDNICIMEYRSSDITKITWSPIVTTRHGYSQNDGFGMGFNTLQEAVDFGKWVSEKTGITLSVSTKYLNRPETKDLKCY